MFAITWAGMTTSLGVDVDTSCAAARAGISRRSALDYFPLMAGDGDIVGVTGHVAPLITTGFEGVARLARLAEPSLTGALAFAGSTGTLATGLYLSLPSSRRTGQGLSIIADEERRAASIAEAEALSIEWPSDDSVAEQILSYAKSAVPGSADVYTRCLAVGGHTGFIDALSQALEDLSERRIERAIVGGCDSLLGEQTLQWLSAAQRLKEPDYPVGLEPGEAAAFVVVESVDSGSGARPLATIDGIRQEQEPGSMYSGLPPTGAGISQTLAGFHDVADWAQLEQVWVLSDLNGEVYRAKDWGMALMRLSERFPVFGSNLAHWYPCESFGDVGAASGAVAACLAMVALQRQYAPCASALLVSAADDGARSGLALSAGRARS